MSDNRLIKATDQQSGIITQKLEVATTTAAYVTPVPDEYPGTITLEPGTSNEETVYFKSKDDETGTINELTRDYTLRNGGTGIEHQSGASWETLQNTLYINNIIDAFQEGYYEETGDVVKVDGETFTVEGNKIATYNEGRLIRLNQSGSYLVSVVSSSYSAGTGLTTVIVTGATVPTLTHVEVGLQPEGATLLTSATGRKAYATPTDNGDAGATVELDFADEDTQVIELTENCVLSYANVQAGKYLSVLVKQDGTGAFTLGLGSVDKTFATTDVTAATDTIAIGTDLLTGTKVQVSSSTTLPAGLSASTDYFVIRSSATEIQLAASYADAIAGTQIDITDTGTGTHTLEIVPKSPGGTGFTPSTGAYAVDIIGFRALTQYQLLMVASNADLQ